MNQDDLIKAAPELRNIVALIVGGSPVAEIVKSIVVPPFAVLGKRMADRVERFFDKAGKMVQDAQFTPQPVSDKLIIEIVRGASVEDDEDLHTMWAALLANAASPENTGKVRPGFIAILRQMAPDEAALLNTLADLTKEYDLIFQNTSAATKFELDKKIGQKMELLVTRLHKSFKSRPGETEAEASERFETCLNFLSNAGLVDGAGDMSIVNSFGRAFLNSCRPPKPQC